VSRRFGIPAAPAREQAQKQQESFPTETTQPLPAPTGEKPFRASSDTLGVKPAVGGKRTFYVIGDSGGILNGDHQRDVVQAMVARGAPDFVYHLGDVDYFNGAWDQMVPQFFEANAQLVAPIVGIPGNHDGDPLPGSVSLDAWVKVFCSSAPELLAGTEEYRRDSQTQPNCYWTLLDPVVTIIGCYSNVPSGGVIEPDQAEWLQGELAAAPTGVPLVVALHHPPYSIDAFHGGSATMGRVLDTAFAAAGRWPELVMSGHVHDAQFFTRTVESAASSAGKPVTYLVLGNSGYHNLHALASDAQPNMHVTDDTVFNYGDDKRWGFLAVTAGGGTLNVEYVAVDRNGVVLPAQYRFAVSALG
jgi:hypothetical protein